MYTNINDQVIRDFKWYYDKGYITSRDGNAAYSYKDGYVVTVSGAKKDNLQWGDFLLVDSNGNSTEISKKPSIETAAHVAALKNSGKSSSVHVHSPNTVALAALFNSSNSFRPGSIELIAVLNSKWPELFRYTKVGHVVPFFEPGSSKLHDSIISSLTRWELELRTDENGEPDHIKDVIKFNDIVIMQRHGVLAIGDSFTECMEHIVRLEHISTILLKIITASGGNLESIL